MSARDESSDRAGDGLAFLARMDIYLIDQLLRGRLSPASRVLDAGCGVGRNLAYLLRRGGSVCGVDTDPEAIEEVRRLAALLGSDALDERFRVEPVERMSFEDGRFDVVISNAVLHFARDAPHFDAMLTEMWRVLAPGGLLFARLATSIGLDGRIRATGGGWFDLPDGSSRFLVDERKLLDATEGLGAALADPIKTTLVQNLRSMTTWVIRKAPAEEESESRGSER